MKFLKSEDLTRWLDELAAEQQVLTPQPDGTGGDALVFKAHEPGAAPVLTRQATLPPKKVLFPASEKLVKFDYTKDPENLGKVEVQLKETIHPEPTVVFGGRTCDARGFLIFDRVYDSVKIKDVYYAARREATSFVTLVCTQSENSCFCTAVGSGPADETGSDVLMTPVDGGYTLEAVSAKGEKLLGSKLLADGKSKADEAAATKAEATQAVAAQPDFTGSIEGLMKHFDNLPFWEDASAKCISCGACTYMCPTCYCFNITDEQYGLKGIRLRSWDNCMSYQFTNEASGHNPRPTKAHRWRNRAGHKFSYYPEIHDGTIACCGCGRCIKQCPTAVDIREIVTTAIATEPAETESA